MAPPQLGRDWRYYLVAPRGARPTWFTPVFMGIFLLLAGLSIAVYYYADLRPRPPGVTLAGGWTLMLFAVALFAGGIYLKGTNPELGIVRPGEGNTEDKGPSLRRPGHGWGTRALTT